jgi:hypothetical protein
VTIRIETSKESSKRTPSGLLRTVWGYIYENEQPGGVYFVRWNDERLEDGLTVLVSVGDWADGAAASSRQAVALLGKEHAGHLAFMVIDAAQTDWAGQEFLGNFRDREGVLGTALAKTVFHYSDHIVLDDPRVAALRARLESASD